MYYLKIIILIVKTNVYFHNYNPLINNSFQSYFDGELKLFTHVNMDVQYCDFYI